MADLPVTEMILYKHGVGFFRREGKVKEDLVTLTFRHDEINDVLKSLVVLDRGDGEVLGIHYQTPLDPALRADSSIQLSESHSLLDLLRDLRGRSAELSFAEDSVRGRIIGVDVEDEEPLSDTLISVLRDDGEVRVYRLKTLRSFTLRDDRAAHDLTYFLDNSLSEELRRNVTVRLSPGKHKLIVYYVAPSPTWRVSYRMVAESDEDRQGGEALLQGWGLFDNRLEEDLEDVQVTLVAGQPISFIYDLYSSRIPERPVVEDEARTTPGPVEFRGALRQAKAAGRPPREARMMAAAAPAPAMIEVEERAALSMDAYADAAPAAAEGREAGEFFQYVVTQPVSVRRGESALVPILGSNLRYARELLYNGAKLPRNPVVALRFRNETGLTLERGPVTIVDDGEYRGEAIVPFTRVGQEVYLAYAVELGVTVTERVENTTEMAGLDIRDRYLVINEYRVSQTTYTIENATPEDKMVTVEAAIRTGWEQVDTAPPDAETAGVRRWRVPVAAGESASFTRSERHLTTRHEQLRSLNYRRLQDYLQGRWLDRETFNELATLLDSLSRIEQAQAQQQELHAEQQRIYERQAQLRENLTALKPAGEEGVLRVRVLHQLQETEDRLEAIGNELAALAEQIEQAQQQVEAILDSLS